MQIRCRVDAGKMQGRCREDADEMQVRLSGGDALKIQMRFRGDIAGDAG